MAESVDAGQLAGLRVVAVPPAGLAVLQIDRSVSPKEAERIKAAWRAVTGRECVLLAGGLRVGGVVEDVGTPIFDQLLDERAGRLKLVDGAVRVAGSA